MAMTRRRLLQASAVAVTSLALTAARKPPAKPTTGFGVAPFGTSRFGG